MGRGFESLQAYQFLTCFLRLRGHLNQPTLRRGASEVHFRSSVIVLGASACRTGVHISRTLFQMPALRLLHPGALTLRSCSWWWKDWSVVDKALWAFGKFLKEANFPTGCVAA